MEDGFTPLPVTDDDESDGAGPSKTDAEVMMEMIESHAKANAKDIQTITDVLKDMDIKLSHNTTLLEKLVSSTDDDDVAYTPATKSAGKRRMR